MLLKTIHDIPILGVCLGHQAICAAFGATVTYAKKMMHGKQSEVRFDTNCPLFADCPTQSLVARYHSLAADADTIPEELKITALTTDGEIMAVQHTDISHLRRSVSSGIHHDTGR